MKLSAAFGVHPQLEMPTLTEPQRETVLGELSASVLHLHEHTRGLDSVIDSED